MADDVQQLQKELARLRAYQGMAEYKLEQIGFTLKEAQSRGWVSLRADVRRNRREKKKAAEAEKWAKVYEDRRKLREERKKVGLPVDDPTPSPTEAAYRGRVAQRAAESSAASIRGRVRRLSHQLLLAAAMGKQYRELTVADHSGHVVPGANTGVPLQHRPFDARSDSSLATSEAMARSFRNWVNHEKESRFRSRSRSPDTVMVSSRTDSSDLPSGSYTTSSFTDDDDPLVGAGITGPNALRALVRDPAYTDDSDISESDVDEGFGLTDLDPNDVSDEIIATAYAMLAAAQNASGGRKDWADVLANDILGTLLEDEGSTPPSSTYSDSGSETSDTDTDLMLSDEVKTALKKFDLSPIPKVKELQDRNRKAKGTRQSTPAIRGGMSSRLYGKRTKSGKKKVPTELEAAIAFLQQQQVPTPSTVIPPTPYQGPKQVKKTRKHKKRRSHRRGNKPARPCRSIYDPEWWRVNKTDPNDGVWAEKPAVYRQETDDMETGFITWAEQERRFHHLDDTLRLQDVRGATRAMIFDRKTVDSRVWDPLNRTIVEPRTGSGRRPLHLNPVTTLSLTRWSMFGPPNHLDPLRLPPNPSIEDKKRPLPSASLAQPTPTTARPAPGPGLGVGTGAVFGAGAGTGTGTGIGNQNTGGTRTRRRTPGKRVTFGAIAKGATVPTKQEPTASTTQEEEAAVASVHYPLTSPAATSISSRQSQGHQSATTTPTTVKASPPGPPTPYPKAAAAAKPETPTVTLYEHHHHLPAVPEEAETEAETKEEQDEKLARFLETLHAAGLTNMKKRPATSGSGAGSAAATIKKRRGVGGGLVISSDSEKENAAAAVAGAGEAPEASSSSWDLPPRFPNKRQEKKSVRFQFQDGPSRGMRYGARRALGRLGLTSVRRGNLGPYK